jgi:hypothetical protein
MEEIAELEKSLGVKKLELTKLQGRLKVCRGRGTITTLHIHGGKCGRGEGRVGGVREGWEG